MYELVVNMGKHLPQKGKVYIFPFFRQIFPDINYKLMN